MGCDMGNEKTETGTPKWNGEGLPPVGCMVETENGECKVVSTSEEEGGIVTYSWNDGANIACAWNNKSWINPIETPQQRKERERLEAAYDLYCTGNKAVGNKTQSFDFWSIAGAESKNLNFWLAIVDKTGYRVGGK